LIDIVRVFRGSLVTLAIAAMPPLSLVQAQNSTFHNAPAAARELKNPYEGQQPPNAGALFHLRCARCHGENGEGSGNIPPLKVEFDVLLTLAAADAGYSSAPNVTPVLHPEPLTEFRT
jgi:mono/diheme cytochrome c family protein